MTAPIDRIENVRAQVDDVERQMEVCRAAGVQFSPRMTWQLLSACKSLLGATLEDEKVKIRTVSVEKLDESAKGIFDVRDDPYDDDEWGDLLSVDKELYLCQARAAFRAAGLLIEGDNQ